MHVALKKNLSITDVPHCIVNVHFKTLLFTKLMTSQTRITIRECMGEELWISNLVVTTQFH